MHCLITMHVPQPANPFHQLEDIWRPEGQYPRTVWRPARSEKNL